LRGGGDAIFPLVQIAFGQADTLQQGRWVNIVLSKRGDRQSREEASRCRQQAGPSSGLSSVLPSPLLHSALLPSPILSAPVLP